MTITVTLPRLGEMTTEAVLIEWLVAPGDKILAGEPVAIVETDKVEATVPTPTSGVVSALHAEVEDEIDVGAPLCSIEPSGSPEEI